MSAFWRTQRHPELDSGTIQLVVDTSVVPRHPQAKLGDPVKQKMFFPVTASASVAVHSEDLDCFVGLRPPRNDDKLVTSYQDQIFTPRNDSKLNVPSSTGGRIKVGAIPKGVKHSTSQLGIVNTNLEVRCKTC